MSKRARPAKARGAGWPGPPVRPSDRFAGAAYRVLAAHFRQMVGSEPGTRDGRDPEALHEMRVATRRLRAALRIFAGALTGRRAPAARAELKWIASVLGPVRSLDVQLAMLDAGFLRRATPPVAGAGLALRAHLTTLREAARAKMAVALGSRRWLRFRDGFGRFLAAGAPRRNPAPWASRPVAEAAPELLRGRLRRTLAEGRALAADSSAEDLHSFRLACKSARYLCESFAGLYGRPAARMAGRLQAVQDALGAHRDSIEGQGLLAAFARRGRSRRGGLSARDPGIGALAAWYLSLAEAARRRFAAAWKRLDRRRPQERLFRQMARLALGAPAAVTSAAEPSSNPAQARG